ncbi:MAG TPA: ABC transporter ATP-binding protein [Candidatus Limnocylindrales bacterium]|nr:ABC transporter ATP-binding protein [Candidatus Limnocylindrales bacterium]
MRVEDEQPIVRLRDVSKRFGERLAVDRLDLQIPRGCCFGLLGPNGAGKTTTLRMIFGVARPTAGNIEVFGMDIATQRRAIRAQLGVTLQDNVLIEALTPAENLRVFCRYHLMRPLLIEHRIEELIDFLALQSHRDVPVRDLSGGFRRRLAVALSLVNSPKLLILDEPTTGLDPAVRQALWNIVRELRDGGTTILLTTHYMDEAERLCDRVAIMAEGRVIADGAPRELITGLLAPETVEFDAGNDESARLLEDFTPRIRRLRSGRRTIVHLDDAAALVTHMRSREPGVHRQLMVRATNLEDVFLHLTGSKLEGGM